MQEPLPSRPMLQVDCHVRSWIDNLIDGNRKNLGSGSDMAPYKVGPEPIYKWSYSMGAEEKWPYRWVTEGYFTPIQWRKMGTYLKTGVCTAHLLGYGTSVLVPVLQPPRTND